MRFMVMVRADKNTEAGVMPSQEMLAAMGKFNEELVNAGVMLAGEGLHPSSKGARIRFENGRATVTDGPFPETKELIAGFWLWKVNSKEEALEWLRRVAVRRRCGSGAAAGVRGRRLRRRTHARAEGPGGTAACPDR